MTRTTRAWCTSADSKAETIVAFVVCSDALPIPPIADHSPRLVPAGDSPAGFVSYRVGSGR